MVPCILARVTPWESLRIEVDKSASHDIFVGTGYIFLLRPRSQNYQGTISNFNQKRDRERKRGWKNVERGRQNGRKGRTRKEGERKGK